MYLKRRLSKPHRAPELEKESGDGSNSATIVYAPWREVTTASTCGPRNPLPRSIAIHYAKHIRFGTQSIIRWLRDPEAHHLEISDVAKQQCRSLLEPKVCGYSVSMEVESRATRLFSS
jgi:hypothetical protein